MPADVRHWLEYSLTRLLERGRNSSPAALELDSVQ
jgi:hypothetical protein